MRARTQPDSATAVADCCHHWVLGAPQDGVIKASCRKCGGERVYPAVLDDLDPRAEPEGGQQPGVATAVGGARPSSVAVPSTQLRTGPSTKGRTGPSNRVKPRLLPSKRS